MTRDDEVLLQDAVNVLGNPTDINLVGSRGFAAESSPTGLPSAPSPDVGAPSGTAMPTAAGGGAPVTSGGAEAGEAIGGGGPTSLQRALQALGLAQSTFGAAQKLQNLPGREANAFNLASTGLQDLGFSLGGQPGAGFVETPIGALSQQDYQGLLEAFRSGTEAPSAAADLLGQGGFTLGGGAGDLATAAGGVDWGNIAGIGGGAALAALPVIMAALRAAGVEIPQSVAQGISTGGLTAGALGAASGALPAAGAATGIGVAAAPILASIMGEVMHRLEPSEDWITFPGRLSRSMTLEDAAARQFGNRLMSGEIQNRQQLADEVARYRATLGTGPETFESGTFSYNLGPEYQQYLGGLSDPFQLPALPGATGTRHEGGQNVDFGPMQGALDQLMAAYQAMLPAGEVGPSATNPWTLQELGLSRHPYFYNPFWNLPAETQEQGGGGESPGIF